MEFPDEIATILDSEFSDPSSEFMDFFARRLDPNIEKIDPDNAEVFKKMIKESLDLFLEERIELILKSAVDAGTTDASPEFEEWRDYYFVDPTRIVIRGEKSFCPITFGNNNKKTRCRFYFNSKQKYVGFFDTASGEETKISVNKINEFVELTEYFKNRVSRSHEKIGFSY
jgi:hypothetical protein